jgi:hypothetical protein
VIVVAAALAKRLPCRLVVVVPALVLQALLLLSALHDAWRVVHLGVDIFVLLLMSLMPRGVCCRRNNALIASPIVVRIFLFHVGSVKVVGVTVILLLLLAVVANPRALLLPLLSLLLLPGHLGVRVLTRVLGCRFIEGEGRVVHLMVIRGRKGRNNLGRVRP